MVEELIKQRDDLAAYVYAGCDGEFELAELVFWFPVESSFEERLRIAGVDRNTGMSTAALAEMIGASAFTLGHESLVDGHSVRPSDVFSHMTKRRDAVIRKHRNTLFDASIRRLTGTTGWHYPTTERCCTCWWPFYARPQGPLFMCAASDAAATAIAMTN